jgi:hypothetical protein
MVSTTLDICPVQVFFYFRVQNTRTYHAGGRARNAGGIDLGGARGTYHRQVNYFYLALDELQFDALIKGALARAPANPPIDFDQITALNFTTWVDMGVINEESGRLLPRILHLRRPLVGPLVPASRLPLLNTPVAARCVCGDFGGLEKRIARAVGAGDGDIKSAKIHSHFRCAGVSVRHAQGHVSRCGLRLNVHDSVMDSHVPAVNTVSICFSHLEWREDALRVFFCPHEE